MTSMTLFDSTLCTRLCLALLHSVWQVALLALAATIFCALLRKRSVELHYAVHLTALVLAMLLLPVTFETVQVASPELARSQIDVPVEGFKTNGDQSDLRRNDRRGLTAQTSIVAIADSTKNFFVSGSSDDQRSKSNLTSWLAVLYVAGVLVMLTRLGTAIVRVERLRRRAHPVTSGPLLDSLRTLSEQWSVHCVPAVAWSESVALPKLVGLLRPTLLLPVSVLAGLSTSELEMILVHELAHVRRYDLWVNLLQRIVEVALFFNPAAWYLSRTISTLREHCCDEMACGAVTGSGPEPRLRHASALLRVVELAMPSQASHGELTALAAAGRSPSELRRRVARLLGDPIHDPIRLSRGGVLALLTAVVVATCGPVLTQTGAQTSKPDAPKSKRIVQSDPAATEVFSFGSKLEILALGSHDKEPQKWWDIHGRPLESVPFTCTFKGQSTAPDVVYRKVVFRIHNYPADAHINWSITPAHVSQGGTVSIDGKQPEGYYTRYFGVPKDCQTVSLKVGVAAGNWKTVTKATGSGAFGSQDLSVVFSDRLQTDAGTVLIVSHNCFDRDFRIVAVDKQQEIHPQIGYGGASAGKIYQSTATFPKLAASDIDHFEFQTREFEWIEFEDLPLAQDSER